MAFPFGSHTSVLVQRQVTALRYQFALRSHFTFVFHRNLALDLQTATYAFIRSEPASINFAYGHR